MFFWIFALTPTFIIIILLIRVTFSTIKFIFTFTFIFIPVIVLQTLKFKSKSSVLFGTHTLLDRSLRVLQLHMHLSKVTANG